MRNLMFGLRDLAERYWRIGRRDGGCGRAAR
jgi:hypothetical protein